jgi:hypothetical protein
MHMWLRHLHLQFSLSDSDLSRKIPNRRDSVAGNVYVTKPLGQITQAIRCLAQDVEKPRKPLVILRLLAGTRRRARSLKPRSPHQSHLPALWFWNTFLTNCRDPLATLLCVSK